MSSIFSYFINIIIFVDYILSYTCNYVNNNNYYYYMNLFFNFIVLDVQSGQKYAKIRLLFRKELDMFEKLLEINQGIDDAIRQFKPENNQENLQAIITAVQKCIKAKGKFLVPITNPDADNGQDYMIRTTYNPEGKLYAVAFTNEDEVEKGAETATLLYDINTFLNVCLATERLDGLAFNPWGNVFYMPRSVIRLIQETAPEGEDEYIQDNALLNSAIYFATEKHAGQLRKTSKLPYILHPLETMHILSTMKADAHLLIAGVLHDTLEDTDATLNELILTFGDDVAELVSAHTDDNEKSWLERKTAEIESCKNGSPRLKMLILADKLSNLRTMHRDEIDLGEKLWDCFSAPKEKQSWFYSEMQEALDEMQHYKETAPVYWEMVDLYKYLFVTYYYDHSEKCLYQISTHKEGYKFEKANPTWVPFEGEIPETATETSKFDAERLEDAWSILNHE